MDAVEDDEDNDEVLLLLLMSLLISNFNAVISEFFLSSTAWIARNFSL